MARPTIALTLLATLALLASGGCGSPPSTAPTLPTAQSPDTQIPMGTTTEFFTSNVLYRVDPDIVAYMPDMNADIHVFDQNQPFVPANINDFEVQIHTCHMIIDQDSMSALMNKYVFNYPGSPLSNIKITALNGRLEQTCTMKKFGIPVTTELDGPLTPDGQGAIVFRPDTIKADGIPVKGLLDMLGENVANLINSNPDQGIQINGDNITMYPARMLPPPVTRGQVMGVEVTPGKIELDFDDGVHRPVPPLPVAAPNYILMWGGNILINQTLALNAKFEMVDETPQTGPMQYYMKVYREQLEAGFTVDREDGSTIAYLPNVPGTTVQQGVYSPQLPFTQLP